MSDKWKTNLTVSEYNELLYLIKLIDMGLDFDIKRYNELINIIDMDDDEYREYRIDKLI